MKNSFSRSRPFARNATKSARCDADTPLRFPLSLPQSPSRLVCSVFFRSFAGREAIADPNSVVQQEDGTQSTHGASRVFADNAQGTGTVRPSVIIPLRHFGSGTMVSFILCARCVTLMYVLYCRITRMASLPPPLPTKKTSLQIFDWRFKL